MATLNTPRPTADYTCSQAELYSGLKTAWNSQAEHEAEFILENTKYTASLSVSKKAAIQAAKVLPDGQARYAESEDLRIDLEEQLDKCLGKWNSLDGYIKKAFKGAHYKPRIEEAGKGYYETAANKDWEDVSLLLEAGKSFIGNHTTALETDGGMPTTPSFADAFDDEKEAFDELYEDFKDARQDAQEQTDAKINANNAIYETGREMMEDGKHIFRKNASVRERFIWEKILEMLTPDTGGGAAGATEASREGSLNTGNSTNINIADINGTDDTMVTIEIDGPARFWGSNVPAGFPGAIFYDPPIGTTIITAAEFKTLTGLSAVNLLLNVQNIGAGILNWKITFDHLEP